MNYSISMTGLFERNGNKSVIICNQGKIKSLANKWGDFFPSIINEGLIVMCHVKALLQAEWNVKATTASRATDCQESNLDPRTSLLSLQRCCKEWFDVQIYLSTFCQEKTPFTNGLLAT